MLNYGILLYGSQCSRMHWLFPYWKIQMNGWRETKRKRNRRDETEGILKKCGTWGFMLR